MFLEKQLGDILTAVLAIPLADDLPTPNARKTCALAIWLIQVQRLSADVLKPAASRIAYALRRGLDGELGKEGKKGSANDGLKVHIFAIIDRNTLLNHFNFRPSMTSLFIFRLYSYRPSWLSFPLCWQTFSPLLLPCELKPATHWVD